MRGDPHWIEIGVVALMCAALLWLVFSILGWFFSLFRGSPEPEIPPTEDEEMQYALRVVKRARQMPDGSWQHLETKWVPCEAPTSNQPLKIHDPTAPGHDKKTCEFCQHRPNYSGASYRSV